MLDSWHSPPLLVVSTDYYGYARAFSLSLRGKGLTVKFIDLNKLKNFTRDQVLSYVYRIFLSLDRPILLLMGGSVTCFAEITDLMAQNAYSIVFYLYDNLSRYPRPQISSILRKVTHFASYSQSDVIYVKANFPKLKSFYLPLYSLSSSSSQLPSNPSLCFFGALHSQSYRFRRFWLKQTDLICKELGVPFYIYSSGSLTSPLKLLRDIYFLPECMRSMTFKNFDPNSIATIVQRHTGVLNLPADDQYDGLPMRVFETLANSRYLITPYLLTNEYPNPDTFIKTFCTPIDLRSAILEIVKPHIPIMREGLSPYSIDIRTSQLMNQL